MDSIPQPLPANTKSLFVTGNYISTIGVESFPTRLELLTDLYLNGNEIKSVNSTVFDNLPNLLRLDLTNNKILHFSARAFPVNNTLQVLILSRAFHHSSIDVVLSFLQSGILLHLTSLDLSNNDFVILPDDIFTSLSKLTNLSLQNCSLIALQNGTLASPPLRLLDLRDNSLRGLPNVTLAEFSLKPGLRVHLAGNPWRCDCFIEDLLAWLKDSELVSDRQNLTCLEPGNMKHVPLLQLEPSQLSECNYSGEMKGVLETSYVFLGLVLALIGVIFLLVLYMNRKGIKRWIYNIRDACRDHMEGYHYRYEINSDPRLANLSINSDV